MKSRFSRASSLAVFLTSIVLLASCDLVGSLFAPPVEELSGTIEQNRTLKAQTYLITESVYVSATLTIPAGATLKFDTYGYLGATANGNILATGTEAKPIRFISNKAAKGKKDYWGIEIDGNGSIFTYCIFESAEHGLTLDGSNNSVTYSTFENNEIGIDADGAVGSATISNNEFVSNTEPLIIRPYYNLDASNTFEANTNQRILLGNPTWGTAVTNLQWSETEVPYYLNDNLAIEKTLTLAAGTTLHFGQYGALDVLDTGTLSARGTATNPIIFTSGRTNKAKSDWWGIEIDGNGSLLSYAQISYTEKGLILNSADVTLSDMTFSNNTVGLDYSIVAAFTPPTSITYTNNTTNFVAPTP